MSDDRYPDDIVRSNAEKDPTYCPYCMRCRGLQRMRKVAAFQWACPVCPAKHDARTDAERAENVQ